MNSNGASVIILDTEAIDNVLGDKKFDVEAIKGFASTIVWHELHHAQGLCGTPVSQDGCDHSGLHWWTHKRNCHEVWKYRQIWENNPSNHEAFSRFEGLCIMDSWLSNQLQEGNPLGDRLKECRLELANVDPPADFPVPPSGDVSPCPGCNL